MIILIIIIAIIRSAFKNINKIFVTKPLEMDDELFEKKLEELNG